MNTKAPLFFAGLVLVSTLFASFAFAQQQPVCGNRVCETSEESSCPKDCEGLVPPNYLSLPIVFGVILVVLLVIAGYAATARGGPTDYWKKRHASKRKKK